MKSIHDIAKDARAAARILATKSTAEKNAVLERIANGLEKGATAILSANEKDVAHAKEKDLSAAMIDRLALDDARLAGVAKAVREIIALADPVGEVVTNSTRPNGLSVTRVRVPLGVIAMVYESRPNVTADASALTLKAGNAVILRGGSEAFESNMAIAKVIHEALAAANFPETAVQVLPTTDRDAIIELLHQTEFVDLAIPRGGEALIKFVTENARVPVVQHFKGVCHLFVDETADLTRAVDVIVNAKLSRPSACNALECVLVHKSVAETLIPPLVRALVDGGCEIRADDSTRKIAGDSRTIVAATEEDFGQEFLAPVLAMKCVASLDEALLHIARYGSSHTEAILTTNDSHAERFKREVDAACVMVNASTRFHDGGELGLGAEIGIATSRLHWREPMGLESLTTMKWVVQGFGQVRG